MDPNRTETEGPFSSSQWSSSHVTALLRSNFSPASQERRYIEEQICGSQKSAEAHDMARGSIGDDEREDKIDIALRIKGLLAPIRKLPDEILTEIFCRCVPERTIDLDKLRIHFKVIGNLGAVCWRWRGAITRIPELWRIIDTGMTTLPREPTRHDIQHQAELFVSTSLSRSGNLPLTIGAVGRCITSKIMDSICAHSDRWEHLILDLNHLNLRTSSIPIKLPMLLRSIQLCQETKNVPTGIIDIFQNAPLLVDVYLNDIHDERVIPSLPWKQLTSLSLAEHSFAPPSLDVGKIIRQTPFLIELRVHFSSYRPLRDSLEIERGSIHLQHLRTLSMTAPDIEVLTIINMITAPALANIVLKLENGSISTERMVTDSFVDMLGRSTCSLTTAKMWIFSSENMVRILRQPECTEIETFELKGCHGAADVLRALTWRGKNRYLPQLRDFTINGHHYSGSCLVDMIKSRVAASAGGGAVCLGKVTVEAFPLSDAMVKEFESLHEEGGVKFDLSRCKFYRPVQRLL